MISSDKNAVLKKYFGYECFREGQEQIVDSILSGKDTLCVMPTGAGKSICYQVPALMMSGITIVISPLISLMQDQVTSLVQSGIRAAYINSSLTMNQLYAVMKNAENGVYKLIYVAPERLDTELFLNFAKKADISMITVDEAHCISQWGQDFRPSYMGIPEFARQLPVRPVITAFTATATDRVRKDITEKLELKNPFSLVTGFDRENLYFEVRRPSDKFSDLKRLVSRYTSEGRSGIIYCSTRKNVESVCEKLCDLGFSASRYHAGLPEEEKHDNQEDFIYDRVKVMVATNAFGMGIDKSNVTFVIHYNMPKDVESYYQEAGRAGRDGSPSDCIMLYSGQDVITAKFLINKSYEESEQDIETAEETRRRDLKRLNDMAYYCTSDCCLRGYILRYFGEKSANECGNCSFCCSDNELKDITVEAQKIMSCIFRAGQNLGVKMICNILRGSKIERITASGYDKLTTYGIMKDCSEKRIMLICDKLLAMGYVEKSEGEYPVLKLTTAAAGVLKGTTPVFARLPEERIEREEVVCEYDSNLMNELKKLRASIASVQGVPAYMVFSDASLRDMCVKLPSDDNEFLMVSGVGQTKLERYGDKFLKAIADYKRSSSPVQMASAPIKKSKLKSSKEISHGFEEIIGSVQKVNITEESLTITAFTDRILTDTEAAIACTPLRKAITGWLTEKGFLSSEKDADGHETKIITDSSADIGIFHKNTKSAYSGKEYISILYTPQAQRFILDNLNAVKEFALSQQVDR